MECHNTRLTSSEIANLWANYVGDSMSICVFTHFLAHVDDSEIIKIIEDAIDLAKQHVHTVAKLFNKENIPIPLGFTENDVNSKAQRLFHDTFYLQYIKQMTKGGLATYSAILPNVYRTDVRDYFSSCLSSTMELYNKATNLLLSKGLEVRAPYIPYPEKVEFVHKQRFLAGWFGERRTLTGLEITHLFANIQTNKVGESLTLGFAQIAKNNEVKKYLQRGVEMSQKHIKLFSDYLKADNLPVPMHSDAGVTSSTESPFSDKLLMYHVGLLSSAGMGNYGVAMSLSPRRDLTLMYELLLTEVGLYAEDGANINIKNHWMEKPPQTVNRDDLLK